MIQSNTVILKDTSSQTWLHFSNPVKVYAIHEIDQVLSALQEIEQRVNTEKLFAAGFISYEAAPAFDPALQTHPAKYYPLLWFGMYQSYKPYKLPIPKLPSASLKWQSSISQNEYKKAVHTIGNYIQQGQTYQVNFTFRLSSPFDANAFDFFNTLQNAQQADHCAFIQTDDIAICSASPELFFKLNADRLISKPMKGTASRGLTWENDQQQRENLFTSEKNRAENVMIVDMVRNDMGRIAETGSVQVSSLFDIEKYPSVFQMVSTVECRTQVSISKIFEALFPPASITGAPKPRTMQIIRKLENSPRDIYTGTIGYIAPERRAQFNVAIRTVSIQQNRATFGVGGGIVWDSIPTDEFIETQTKAKILTYQMPSFALLETMLWQPDEGIFLLDLHLERLKKSADYFSFAFNPDKLLAALLAKTCSVASPQKIRILLYKDKLDIQVIPLKEASHSLIIASPAKHSVDSQNIFLYHKTTHRQIYETAKGKVANVDEILLYNEKGMITEFCLGNIVYKQNGELYTPPIKNGLLGGTFRQFLLNSGEIKKKSLSIKKLDSIQEIYLINSVQKWRRVKIERLI